MSDWVTLFAGTEESAESLSRFLSSRSVQVYKHFVRGPIVSAGGVRETTVEVRVPADEIETARPLYAEWCLPQAGRANEIARRVMGIFLLSLGPPAAWLALHHLGVRDVPAPAPNWLVGIWFVSLVVVGQLEGRRRRCETIGRTR